MTRPIPIVLIPGLVCTPRFYAAQIPSLWRHGPLTLADSTRDDTMQAIVARLLTTAPPRFAVVGHSMGGYVALELIRQAPERVLKLALLDTAARADSLEQTGKRRKLMALAASGRFSEVQETLYPAYVHPNHRDDPALRQVIDDMASDCGPEVFIRQENAIISRAEMRLHLAAIKCPTLVLVGDSDEATPPDRSTELAAGIAGSRLVVVANSGHMTALEQPDAVTQALVEWLRD